MYSKTPIIKINHLLFGDYLKPYGKDESRVRFLGETVYTFGADIPTEFGLKNCDVPLLKWSKIKYIDGLTIFSRLVMELIKDSGYKNMGIVEMDKIMEKEMTKN